MATSFISCLLPEFPVPVMLKAFGLSSSWVHACVLVTSAEGLSSTFSEGSTLLVPSDFSLSSTASDTFKGVLGSNWEISSPHHTPRA